MKNPHCDFCRIVMVWEGRDTVSKDGEAMTVDRYQCKRCRCWKAVKAEVGVEQEAKT